VLWLNLTTTHDITLACSVRRKGNHVAAQESASEAEASATCPACATELVITSITPILFGGEFEYLTLTCAKCDFTKTLKIKRN
jgi:hypothetical protein